MIQYPITEAELWNRIDAQYPTWRNRSQKRTDKFIKAGKYNEKKGIWSEIKSVYMQLQHAKCGYCEKWLEHKDFGSIEHDVEHYRPKSHVRAYPPTSDDPAARDPRCDLKYDFPTGGEWDTGYYRLAYHPLNYLTTCKTCNTILKSDYFPVGAAHIDGADHPRDLAAEEPFLLYPLSDLDPAPETLIGFEGILAIPIGTTLSERRRAEVTIDFFQLNNRDDLRRQRATLIHGIHLHLSGIHRRPPKEREEVVRHIEFLLSPKAYHTNCSRCFVKLMGDNPVKSAGLAKAAGEFIRSGDSFAR